MCMNGGDLCTLRGAPVRASIVGSLGYLDLYDVMKERNIVAFYCPFEIPALFVGGFLPEVVE